MNFFFTLVADHVSSLTLQRLAASKNDVPAAEAAHCFSFTEIQNATNDFEKKIGSGGFGVVYYGVLKDGKEIAVKVLNNTSYQGKREFSNEVNCIRLISFSVAAIPA